MIYTIQAYRGIAVLMVALFHGNIMVASRYGVPPFFDIFSLGFAGVHLFFVLSGFIILTAHARDIGHPHRLGWYLGRRLIRIYPIYWLIFFVWGGWKLVSMNPDWVEFARNAFLFMADGKPVIPVSWTLLYEIIFYAVFAILIISKRIGVAIFGIWFLAILLNWGKSNPHLMHPFNLLFILGLTAAVLTFRLRKLSVGVRNICAMAGLMMGIATFLGTAAYYSGLSVDDSAWPQHPVAILGFGLGSALLVLGSASERVEYSFKEKTFLALLGNASYSIYLVHIQFEKIAFNLVKSVGWIWNGGEKSPIIADFLLTYIAGVAVLLGIIVHLKIEKPLLKYLREKMDMAARRTNSESGLPTT